MTKYEWEKVGIQAQHPETGSAEYCQHQQTRQTTSTRYNLMGI